MPVQSFPKLSPMLPCPGASLSLSHSPRLRNNPPFMSPIVGSEWLCHDVPSTRVRLYLISAGSRPPPPLSFVVCLGLPRASSVALAAILAIPSATSISSLFQQSYEATNDSRTPSQATTGRVPEGYHPAILRGGRCSMGAILLSPGRYDLGWARPVNHATPALYPLVPRLRVVFWNRITPFHSRPGGEPRYGCRTGEVADGISRRRA